MRSNVRSNMRSRKHKNNQTLLLATLTSILSPTEAATLSVVNNTAGALTYANSSLTVTRLA